MTDSPVTNHAYYDFDLDTGCVSLQPVLRDPPCRGKVALTIGESRYLYANPVILPKHFDDKEVVHLIVMDDYLVLYQESGHASVFYRTSSSSGI